MCSSDSQSSREITEPTTPSRIHSSPLEAIHASYTSWTISSSVFCFGSSGSALRRNSRSSSSTDFRLNRSSRILCALRASLTFMLYHPFLYRVLNLHQPKNRHLPACLDCAGMPRCQNIHYTLVNPCTSKTAFHAPSRCQPCNFHRLTLARARYTPCDTIPRLDFHQMTPVINQRDLNLATIIRINHPNSVS